MCSGAKMKNESFDQLAYARRIRRAGRPIHIPEDDGERACMSSNEMRVRQTGGFVDSAAFDFGPGAGIKIFLTITFLRSTLAISSFELKLPWEQTFFQWLEDPLVIEGISNCYRFYGGRQRLEFERTEVLNHKLTATVSFSAGQSVQGYLLGFGDPMPPDIQHGATIPAFIIFYDQRGREFRAPLELWADRTETKLRPERLVAKRRRSIFDDRDVIACK